MKGLSMYLSLPKANSKEIYKVFTMIAGTTFVVDVVGRGLSTEARFSFWYQHKEATRKGDDEDRFSVEVNWIY